MNATYVTSKSYELRRRAVADLGEYLELIQELLALANSMKNEKKRTELTEVVLRLAQNNKELSEKIDELVGLGATSD